MELIQQNAKLKEIFKTVQWERFSNSPWKGDMTSCPLKYQCKNGHILVNKQEELGVYLMTSAAQIWWHNKHNGSTQVRLGTEGG